MKLSPGLIVLISIVAALAIGSCSVFSYVNSVRDDAIEGQQGVVAIYKDAQNELSSYTSKIVEQANVATEKKSALKDIIKGAMEGRYGDKGFGQGSALFVAMKEADLGLGNNLQIYDEIMRSIASGREAYKNKQSAVIDRATAYKVWLDQGLIRSTAIKFLGYPTNDLTATSGTTQLFGRAALDYISTPIINQTTANAYQSGRMEAVDPFKK